MIAGTSVSRTTNASMATPTAKLTAIGFTAVVLSVVNAQKMVNMMSAAAETTRTETPV
jgi:hypothetical protein